VELRKEYEIKTRTPGFDSSLGLVLESQLQASWMQLKLMTI